MKPHTSTEMEVGHLQTEQVQSELLIYNFGCIKIIILLAGEKSSTSTDGSTNAKQALLKSEFILLIIIRWRAWLFPIVWTLHAVLLSSSVA